MRISKLLNKKYLLIIFFLFIVFKAHSEDPVDIWNLNEKKLVEENIEIDKKTENEASQNTIYEMQTKKKSQSNIIEDQTLISKEIEIIGLYDPADYGLDINMWSNSDGEKILKLFDAVQKINLSKDASEILNVLLLTNAYYPSRNISKTQFLKIKSDWLIKNLDLQLIEDYLINNQIINENPGLTKRLVDEHLSRSELKKTCEIFSKINKPLTDNYLSKFNIYCLVNNKKI